MKTVKAFLNHGRWLARCPIHPAGGVMEVKPEQTGFVCPVCYPGSIASFPVVRGGRIQQIPDASARKTAQALAEKDGRVYQIIFPDNADKILSLLANRPPENMNWEPGETLTLLKNDNKQHGVK